MIVNYINHPILFFIQVAGVIALIGSIVVLPVLSIVGFGAAGPVARSCAAAWQASIGLVKSSSIFSWCQTATMSGAAVDKIVATGLIGAILFVSAAKFGSGTKVRAAPDLKRNFLAA